ncbi:MAG: phospho-sugar mutase [Microthrixaceae bacterium]
MTPDNQLESRVRAWVEIDPDPATSASLNELLGHGSLDQLEQLFSGQITFGTAGIRGPLGAGPLGMNRVVVRHTAVGVARELLLTVPEAQRRGVVVGHDARHGSPEFAADVVEVFRAHGFVAHVFGEAVPTPLVAFAIGYLHAAAGIVVTASHNPAADNGMKVYWEDSAQIIAPVDGQIARHVAAVTEESLASGFDTTTSAASIAGFLRVLAGRLPGEDRRREPVDVNRIGGPGSDDPLVREYVRQGLLLIPPARDKQNQGLRIAATSLHGVGAVLLHRLLSDAGYDDIHMVQSQRFPDPDFPTVSFPNPEEPGALDQLLALAGQVDADIAIANDPDADRLAAAFPDPSGAWRVLRGDELGALLAHHLLALTEGQTNRLLATTVVSSRLTARMAASAKVDFRETLTGFKWLCRPGLADPSIHQVLLYEEALGYAVGPRARDKDGITAAMVLVDLAQGLSESHTNVWEILDALALEHGAHIQRNSSIRFEGYDWADQVARRIDRLVGSPPTTLGGHPVIDSDRPADDVLRYFLAEGTRVVVRPSGTEPKVKLYCEAIEPVAIEPAAIEPVAIKPVAIKPVAIEPFGRVDAAEPSDAVHEAVEQARRVASERLDLVEADLRRLLADED